MLHRFGNNPFTALSKHSRISNAKTMRRIRKMYTIYRKFYADYYYFNIFCKWHKRNTHHPWLHILTKIWILRFVCFPKRVTRAIYWVSHALFVHSASQYKAFAFQSSFYRPWLLLTSCAEHGSFWFQATPPEATCQYTIYYTLHKVTSTFIENNI